MQQNSIGQQNQGRNMNITLYDQTRPQPGYVEHSTPIQEGVPFGQARMIMNDTESDAGSLLFNSSDFAGIQATPSFQQPTQSENTGGNSLSSTSPVQSASGFSGVSMNIPSGGHLRPLQSYNEELVGINVDLQVLKRKLKQKLGDTYETIVANCVSTFNGTTLNEADISKCSSQLLFCVGDNAVKCKICKQTGNIGTIFRHEEWCIVGKCSQRDQDVRHSNLPNSTEGDINIPVLPFNQRHERELQDRAARGQTYGTTGGVLQAGGPQSPLLPFNRRQEGELQDRAARGQCYGAAGGVLQAGGPQSPLLPFNRRQEGELQDRAAGGQTYGATGGVLQAGGPQSPLLPFNRRQEGELQDRAARGQTYGAAGGVLQAGGPQSPLLPFNRRQEGELQDRAARGQCYGAAGGVLQAGGPQSSLLPFNRRQEGELQDRAARGQTYGATGGVLQAGGPPSEEISYKAGSYQTCNDSSSFTRGYATAPDPSPNQNVYLPPEIPWSSTRFPAYQRHGKRLNTFHNWQYKHVQCPKALTDAGFFYRGTDDECQCFECGQVLREWNPCDNPWSEHARLSPDCPFVKREKGQAFVKEVRKNTAKKEIRTPPTFFRTNAGRSEANPPRSNQAIITEDCSLLEMGFTKEQIQGAINRFRKVNGNKEYTTEHLIEMIISDENQEGNLMNQSICGACSRREVGVSQFKCGHIVCRKCAAQNIGDLCKICGKQVVKLVLFDAATLKK